MWTPSATMAKNGKVRRDGDRTSTHRNAILHFGDTRVPVTLKDISRGGTHIKLSPGTAKKRLEGTLQLEIPGLMKLPIDLRWQKGEDIGVRFDLPKSRLATLEIQIKRMVSRPGR